MIRVVIERDGSGQIWGYSAQGHAGTGPRGRDIVCAAVSVLTDSAFLGLERHLRRKLTWYADEGNIAVQLQEQPDSATEAIMNTVVLGLKEIEKIHPDKIRISEIRR